MKTHAKALSSVAAVAIATFSTVALFQSSEASHTAELMDTQRSDTRSHAPSQTPSGTTREDARQSERILLVRRPEKAPKPARVGFLRENGDWLELPRIGKSDAYSLEDEAGSGFLQVRCPGCVSVCKWIDLSAEQAEIALRRASKVRIAIDQNATRPERRAPAIRLRKAATIKTESPNERALAAAADKISGFEDLWKLGTRLGRDSRAALAKSLLATRARFGDAALRLAAWAPSRRSESQIEWDTLPLDEAVELHIDDSMAWTCDRGTVRWSEHQSRTVASFRIRHTKCSLRITPAAQHRVRGRIPLQPGQRAEGVVVARTLKREPKLWTNVDTVRLQADGSFSIASPPLTQLVLNVTWRIVDAHDYGIASTKIDCSERREYELGELEVAASTLVTKVEAIDAAGRGLQAPAATAILDFCRGGDTPILISRLVPIDQSLTIRGLDERCSLKVHRAEFPELERGVRVLAKSSGTFDGRGALSRRLVVVLGRLVETRFETNGIEGLGGSARFRGHIASLHSPFRTQLDFGPSGVATALLPEGSANYVIHARATRGPTDFYVRAQQAVTGGQRVLVRPSIGVHLQARIHDERAERRSYLTLRSERSDDDPWSAKVDFVRATIKKGGIVEARGLLPRTRYRGLSRSKRRSFVTGTAGATTFRSTEE